MSARNKILSVVPYYGGKARMAQFISDKFDYNCHIYAEIFGGGARTLLNKPRHNKEIYNDLNGGLFILMKTLADPKEARELIYSLNNTEYSKREFDKAKIIFDYALMTKRDYVINDNIEDIINVIYDRTTHTKKYIKSKKREWAKLIFDMLEKDNNEKIDLKIIEDIKKDKKDKVIKLLEDVMGKLHNVEEDEATRPASDFFPEITDMDIAIATYIVYTQSWNAQGEQWSNSKTTEQYRKGLNKLFLCSERLNGVEFYQDDAMAFFKYFNYDNNVVSDEDKFNVMGSLIDNPDCMLYLDPSYIKVEDEIKALEGTDWERKPELRLTEIVKSKNKGKLPRNLGGVYAESYSYEDHEELLQCICKYKAKILISNYDLKLYHKYLSLENGWRYIKFETKATSSGKKWNNNRTEVLWYNY